MNTIDIVRQFILTDLNAADNGSELTNDTMLIDSGVVDSMGIIALMSFIEERFSIDIPSEELVPENFDSIRAISSLIDSQAVGKGEG